MQKIIFNYLKNKLCDNFIDICIFSNNLYLIKVNLPFNTSKSS